MNEPIKTASQIIKEKGIDDKLEIDTSKPYPEGLRRVTREAMEEYANQQVACERKRIKEKVRELMFTMPTGRVPREGLNIAFYKVLELIDNL